MKIIYVVPFAYPSSSANSLRVKGMIDALVLAGHEVEICAGISNQAGQDNCGGEECVSAGFGVTTSPVDAPASST